jgi:hypothetical protein
MYADSVFTLKESRRMIFYQETWKSLKLIRWSKTLKEWVNGNFQKHVTDS